MGDTCISARLGLPFQLGQAADQHACQKLNRKPLEVRGPWQGWRSILVLYPWRLHTFREDQDGLRK